MESQPEKLERVGYVQQLDENPQRQKEIIDKIASILVDLVIEEQRQQLLQSQKL